MEILIFACHILLGQLTCRGDIPDQTSGITVGIICNLSSHGPVIESD